jgi:hypothetical protein
MTMARPITIPTATVIPAITAITAMVGNTPHPRLGRGVFVFSQTGRGRAAA